MIYAENSCIAASILLTVNATAVLEVVLNLKDETYVSEVAAWFEMEETMAHIFVVHVDLSLMYEIYLGRYALTHDAFLAVY